MTRKTEKDPLFDIIDEYVVNVELEFKNAWNSWDIVLSQKEIYQVVGGLLARQVSLGTQSLITPAQ